MQLTNTGSNKIMFLTTSAHLVNFINTKRPYKVTSFFRGCSSKYPTSYIAGISKLFRNLLLYKVICFADI